MERKWTRRVDARDDQARIIDYAGRAFPILGSRSAAKKAVSSGRVTINGKEAISSDIVREGDLIELHGSGFHAVKEYNADLEVVYEDDHLIIINKPGGLAVNGNRYKTVENALARKNSSNPQPDALPRIVAVHRLDVPTCGLVVLAKTKSALIRVGRAFQDNRVSKEYLAIVHGKPPESGKIVKPVEGKEAITEFKTLHSVPSRSYDTLSAVALFPITGRTHQLRIHLKARGHLIVGDKMYAEGEHTILGKGLLLCAVALKLRHPLTGKTLSVRIEPPAKFSKVMEREEERF